MVYVTSNPPNKSHTDTKFREQCQRSGVLNYKPARAHDFNNDRKNEKDYKTFSPLTILKDKGRRFKIPTFLKTQPPPTPDF
jgi:hypothetical protein